MSKKGSKPPRSPAPTASKAGGVKRLYGLHAKAYPKNLRDRVDQDYHHKLSPEEKQWLSDFNTRYYDGDFTGDTKHEWSADERRVAYRAKNHANRDAYSIALGGGALDWPEHPADLEGETKGDLRPSPAYLETAEYKAALHWWRQHVINKTTNTPAGKAARWKLERLISEQDEDE